MIPELTPVTLKVPKEHEGKTIPVGSVGAVVFIWKMGAGYVVEFVDPFQAIVDVSPEDIEPVK